MTRETIIKADKPALGDAIAERLAATIKDAVSARGVAHIVLTGGSMGSASLEALRRRGYDDIPWDDVHLWWGDERFLPAGDAERNETQAREALLDELSIPAANIHAMAASDAGVDVEAGAAQYVRELAEHSSGNSQQLGVPHFDVVMLGMGPDTHVASLFPGLPQTQVSNVSATFVANSPKPPPQRITLTFPSLNVAREVWLMIAGADKAEAVSLASEGEDATAHPASAVHGGETTVWWLDEAAAAGLK